MQLSTLQRRETIKQLTVQKFDLIIIGGGITGAGIALDATARGLKILVIEKYDFAGGTSSKSTKLIHGGLRYLKQLEFSMVRQIGRERNIIHKLAPHLVRPVDMLLPIYKKGSLGRFTTSVALRLYDFLAKVKKEEAYKMLGKQAAEQHEPLLKKEGLIGGALYKEYRTDDARLTMAILKSAAEQGAVCLNYVKAESFLMESDIVKGVFMHDLISGNQFSVRAEIIVNAAGPWVDEVRSMQEVIAGKRLHLTKGIHIVVEKNKLSVQQSVYFDVPGDSRMIFVIPRDNIIYIGTTDTDYAMDKDKIDINLNDVMYLIHAVNAMFPSANLKLDDIQSAWAGLRPLIHAPGRSPSALSRKDEIFVSSRGLISIAGGKLTGYRKMAEKIVDLICTKLKKNNNFKLSQSNTANISLHGSDFLMPVAEYTERRAGEAAQIGIREDEIKYFVSTYGTGTEKIIDIAFGLYQQIKDPRERILYAELQYAVDYEMVTNISDFLIRRTGMLYFNKAKADKIHLLVGEMLAEICPLSINEKNNQIAFYKEASDSILQFKG